MKHERRAAVLKWTVYILVFLLLFLLQQTPGLLPMVAGAKPSLLLPAVVCIALYEGENMGAAFGVIAGLLWDLNSLERPLGYSSLVLMVFGCVIGLLVAYWMRNNLLTALLLGIGCIALYEGLTWFIFDFILRNGDSVTLFMQYTLPRAIYTLAVLPILYGLGFLLHKLLTRRKEASVS